MKGYESLAPLFKALMHPARLAILDLLHDGEVCVCHIEAALGYRQAYISQQLMVLRNARLVGDRREGWNVYYRVIEPCVFVVLDEAKGVARGRSVVERSRATRTLRTCPCPKCRAVSESLPEARSFASSLGRE